MTIKMNFLHILGIVFIVLKLVGTIAWDWLWVLAPLWIPLAIKCIIIIYFALKVMLRRP